VISLTIFEIERIERILRDLEKAIYRDSLSIDNYRVREGNFKGGEVPEIDDSLWDKFSTNDFWGGRDRHQWFRGDISVPEVFDGENVVFRITTGHEGEWDALNPQFLFFLDGKMLQGIDVNHREVLISESGEPGMEYKIAFLAYSGINEIETKLTTELCILDKRIENIYYNIKVPLLTAKLLGNDNDDRINILKILG
jgi:alpha-mannosidase